jgi:hypothetical protein
MRNSTDQLTQLRAVLKHSQASLSQCVKTFKAFQAFQGNPGGIVFCTVQLHQSAVALQEDADALVALARELQTIYREIPDQLELNDVEMNGHP